MPELTCLRAFARRSSRFGEQELSCYVDDQNHNARNKQIQGSFFFLPAIVFCSLASPSAPRIAAAFKKGPRRAPALRGPFIDPEAAVLKGLTPPPGVIVGGFRASPRR